MTRLHFLKESLKNLMTIGTVTRSSAILCKQMIREVDFTNGTDFVELGAGDGVVTKHMLKRMRPNARVFAFEVNETFCDKLRAINDDRLIVLQRDATDLINIMAEHNVTKVDGIISAIPFVLLEDEQTERIIEQSKEMMKPNTQFVQIHYSLILKKLYERLFRNVSVQFVPINVPPAFVFRCWD